MVYCAAVGCSNRTYRQKTDEKISFFGLPSDENLRKRWISNLKRENLPKLENVHVCQFHFDDSSFKRDLKVCNF